MKFWFLILTVGNFLAFPALNTFAEPKTQVAGEKVKTTLSAGTIEATILQSESPAPNQVASLNRILPPSLPVDPSFSDESLHPAAVKPAFPDDPPSLFRSLGIPKDQWGMMSQEKDLLSRVNAFSPETKALYKSMSFFEKLKFSKKINGTTDTPLFIIENKPAFISGNVKGYDTFAYLKSSADLDLSLGKITQQAYDKQIKQIKVVSKLTPEERTTLLDLLQGELDSRHSSR